MMAMLGADSSAGPTQVRLSVTVALAFCTQHRLIGSGLALSCYWHMVGTVAAIVLTTLSLRSLAAVRLYSPEPLSALGLKYD